MTRIYIPIKTLLLFGFIIFAPLSTRSHSAEIVRMEHYVSAISHSPAMEGQTVQLYVRQLSSTGSTGPVVLFVHGAGTPAEVAFDTPVAGLNWMTYLAERGLRTYAMDLTGYGRSQRPEAMNNRCNLSITDQQTLFEDTCQADWTGALTTMDSDWQDINAVVEWLLARENESRVHLISWSQGGPRTGGYAALNPDSVASLVQLAPAFVGIENTELTSELLKGPVMTKQTRDDFLENWQRQTLCNNQWDTQAAETIFDAMLESDPVGAGWGVGIRRAPRVPTYGWTEAVVSQQKIPLLIIRGMQDKQIQPALPFALYSAWGASAKVLLSLPCSSHNAMWEAEAERLFSASYSWITKGKVLGVTSGAISLNPLPQNK
jgi:pimeloyl-ACP methyl ester carboxylesterase